MSGNWSTVSTSNATPVYTPATSNIGSVHGGQSDAVNNFSADAGSLNLRTTTPTRTNLSNYNGPETALAIFRYEFTTLPRRPHISTFTLKDHPMDWPSMMQ